MSNVNTLLLLGNFCTNRLCKKCPIHKLAEENHHSCPECFRIPEIAEKAAHLITWGKIGAKMDGGNEGG